jgi:hypothetical protein
MACSTAVTGNQPLAGSREAVVCAVVSRADFSARITVYYYVLVSRLRSETRR